MCCFMIFIEVLVSMGTNFYWNLNVWFMVTIINIITGRKNNLWWMTQNRMIFLFMVIITVIFNIITGCKNDLWWLTQNRLVFCKRILIINVWTVSFIASILNILIWKNMFIEHNIPQHKSFFWLNIQQNISFCPLLKPIKTYFDVLESNLLLFIDKVLA